MSLEGLRYVEKAAGVLREYGICGGKFSLVEKVFTVGREEYCLYVPNALFLECVARARGCLRFSDELPYSLETLKRCILNKPSKKELNKVQLTPSPKQFLSTISAQTLTFK